ncbi:hypothetical protein SLA2020_372920 [Shorea laevis]
MCISFLFLSSASLSAFLMSYLLFASEIVDSIHLVLNWLDGMVIWVVCYLGRWYGVEGVVCNTGPLYFQYDRIQISKLTQAPLKDGIQPQAASCSLQAHDACCHYPFHQDFEVSTSCANPSYMGLCATRCQHSTGVFLSLLVSLFSKSSSST